MSIVQVMKQILVRKRFFLILQNTVLNTDSSNMLSNTVYYFSGDKIVWMTKPKFTKFESLWLGTLDATSIGEHLRVSHYEIK